MADYSIGCCGGGSVPSMRSYNPQTEPDEFQLCEIANHCSEGYSSLNGKATKRSYALRQNGDKVLALKADIIEEPNKFIPIDESGAYFVPSWFPESLVPTLEWLTSKPPVMNAESENKDELV